MNKNQTVHPETIMPVVRTKRQWPLQMPSSRSGLFKWPAEKPESKTGKRFFFWTWWKPTKRIRQSEVKRTETRLTIRILRDFAGEPLTMDQIDKTFYQEYIDYLLTEYRPKGKQESNFTHHTYYCILNGAWNATVRAEVIKVNLVTKIITRTRYVCRRKNGCLGPSTRFGYWSRLRWRMRP